MVPHIVVIEDDADLQKYLQELLTEQNCSVRVASSGALGLSMIKKAEPNLVLLDLTLPDMDGQGLCKEIRKEFPDIAIIMLTAKDEVSDKVKGLMSGADDYLTKPFAADELIARIKVQLRRSIGDKTTITIADLELDPKKIEVKRAGKVISVTPQEFKLLEYLMNNKGVVLSREMILSRIWMYSPDVESRVVDVYMGYLRKKIDSGHKKKLLHSIRGFGYTIKD